MEAAEADTEAEFEVAVDGGSQVPLLAVPDPPPGLPTLTGSSGEVGQPPTANGELFWPCCAVAGDGACLRHEKWGKNA